MNRSTPGLPVHHQLPESTQTHVHRVGDAIQPSHLLLPPSPPAFNLSQHQSLFQWVSSSYLVAKVDSMQCWKECHVQLSHPALQFFMSLVLNTDKMTSVVKRRYVVNTAEWRIWGYDHQTTERGVLKQLCHQNSEFLEDSRFPRPDLKARSLVGDACS